MRKNLIIFISIFLCLALFQSIVYADWWDRTDTRPTQPSLPRDDILPTSPPPTSVPPTAIPPTNSPAQPTVTPRVGGPSITPAPTSSSTSDDPCASGKSYTGPYCGWSQGTGGGESGGDESTPRIGGLPVVGLSNTSSSDLALSDIILLTGVLCLLLYVRSKIKITKSP